MTDTIARRRAQLDELDREIQRAVPHIGEPEPDLAEISADAVEKQHALAAQAIESMGTEVLQRVVWLQGALDDCHNSLQLLARAADTIRDQGKSARAQIEEINALNANIRKMCDDFNMLTATKRAHGA